MTPNSGTSPYLSPSLFVQIKDASSIGSLLIDGMSINTPTPDAATCAASPVVLFCLQRASGEIESHTLRGKYYSVADLMSLQGNSQAMLQGLVASLAFEYLRQKRPTMMKAQPDYDQALKTLEALAEGSQIFAFVEVENAGVTGNSQLTPGERRQLGLATDRASRMFPDTGFRGYGNYGEG